MDKHEREQHDVLRRWLLVCDGQVIHVTGHFFTQPGQSAEVASAGRSFEQLSANVAAEKAADKSRLETLSRPHQFLAERR